MIKYRNTLEEHYKLEGGDESCFYEIGPKTDEDNAEIKQVGDIKNIDNPKDHLEIAEKLGLIDIMPNSIVCMQYFKIIS